MTSSILPTENYTMQRNDSTETDESPFASALATPADEDILQPFDQLSCITMSGASWNEDKLADAGTPKSRSVSKAVQKATQFAQGLARFNEKSAAGSLVLPPPVSSSQSAEVPDAFLGKLHLDSSILSVQRSDSKTFNLPNHTICVKLPDRANANKASPQSIPLPELQLEPELILASKNNQISRMDTFLEMFSVDVEDDDSQDTRAATRNPLHILAKIICFLPWCIGVGGTILLFPRHLERVTFSLGYVSSSSGIRRFAHWADCAMQHVMIFLAFLICLAWFNRPVGVLLATLVISRFLLAWGDFKPDMTVPLGTDDRQTMYLLAMDYTRGNNTACIVKTPEGYFFSPHDLETDVDNTESDEE